jgi:hypothetical protein
VLKTDDKIVRCFFRSPIPSPSWSPLPLPPLKIITSSLSFSLPLPKPLLPCWLSLSCHPSSAPSALRCLSVSLSWNPYHFSVYLPNLSVARAIQIQLNFFPLKSGATLHCSHTSSSSANCLCIPLPFPSPLKKVNR